MLLESDRLQLAEKTDGIRLELQGGGGGVKKKKAKVTRKPDTADCVSGSSPGYGKLPCFEGKRTCNVTANICWQNFHRAPRKRKKKTKKTQS